MGPLRHQRLGRLLLRPHGHLHRTAFLVDVVEAYEIMWIRSECTRSYRVLTGTVIPHAKNSKARAVRLLRRHLELVVGESEDLLAPT
ncbi:hypothetical protein [Streptomyces tropicalis]|uniref:Uncharacterized protein n=1 Tax=Streptomyces tropicalis TaxID=3034234 RepID=A0ABT6A5Y6_9ACTN|nr:hypothetical protein [Streptomyces tropicalis]MDF3300061.1 hypothetical protein [Streptomyces tropicalis]